MDTPYFYVYFVFCFDPLTTVSEWLLLPAVLNSLG